MAEVRGLGFLASDEAAAAHHGRFQLESAVDPSVGCEMCSSVMSRNLSRHRGSRWHCDARSKQGRIVETHSTEETTLQRDRQRLPKAADSDSATVTISARPARTSSCRDQGDCSTPGLLHQAGGTAACGRAAWSRARLTSGTAIPGIRSLVVQERSEDSRHSANSRATGILTLMSSRRTRRAQSQRMDLASAGRVKASPAQV